MRGQIAIALLLWIPSVCWADPSIDLLKKLVEQNSGTQNIAGVNAVQSILKQEFESLGFRVDLIHPPQDVKSGDFLVATLQGQSSKTIALITHADTVFEPSSGFTEFKISDDGKTAYGPGVIDDKGSIVVMIEALKEYLKEKKPFYSLRIVAAPAEETSNPPFIQELFQQYSKDSFLVLGFEPSLDDKNIVTSRRGIRWYVLSVQGREAHSGRAPKHGINACLELADKISKISALTNYDKNVSVSVGHIEGGQDKFNIVCGSAQAKIDARFATLADRDELQKKIDQIIKTSEVRAVDDKEPAVISYILQSDASPFEKQKSAELYIKLYLGIVSRIEGQPISDEMSGGTADSNGFARGELPIIDGLGAVGGKMHTKEESIYLPSLRTRAQALTEFLNNLTRVQ